MVRFLSGGSFDAPDVTGARADRPFRAARTRGGALLRQQLPGVPPQPDSHAGVVRRRAGPHESQLHRAHRTHGRLTALLYGAYPGPQPRQGLWTAGFLRFVQPPHDLAVLSGVGEIPLLCGVRARRGGAVFAVPDEFRGSGHDRLAAPADGIGRILFILLRPVLATAALRD